MPKSTVQQRKTSVNNFFKNFLKICKNLFHDPFSALHPPLFIIYGYRQFPWSLLALRHFECIFPQLVKEIPPGKDEYFVYYSGVLFTTDNN